MNVESVLARFADVHPSRLVFLDEPGREAIAPDGSASQEPRKMRPTSPFPSLVCGSSLSRQHQHRFTRAG